jgi:ribosomal protein S18 acetylase RimI-like enzyme
VINRAREIGMTLVWLTVDAYNFRATRLYKRFGFRFCEEYSASSERMMKL